MHVEHAFKPVAARVCLLGGGDLAGLCHLAPCNKLSALVTSKASLVPFAKASAFASERRVLLKGALGVTAAGLDGELLLALFDAITKRPGLVSTDSMTVCVCFVRFSQHADKIETGLFFAQTKSDRLC